MQAFDMLRKITDAFGVNNGNEVIDLATMKPTGDKLTREIHNAILNGTYRNASAGLGSLFNSLAGSDVPQGTGQLSSLFGKLKGF